MKNMRRAKNQKTKERNRMRRRKSNKCRWKKSKRHRRFRCAAVHDRAHRRMWPNCLGETNRKMKHERIHVHKSLKRARGDRAVAVLEVACESQNHFLILNKCRTFSFRLKLEAWLAL